MRKSTFLSTGLFACCCVFILFAGPAAAGLCDKKPDHPNCNDGGQGGGDHPVDLRFRDNGLLGEVGADRIRSDLDWTGSVTYTDGEPGVSTRIRDDGVFLINIDSTDRAVVFDFSDQPLPPECGGDCKKDFEDASSDEFPPAAVALIQVYDSGGNQHLADGFFGMEIPMPPDLATVHAGDMRIGFGGAGKSTKFSVRFQALDGSLDTNVLNKTSFIEITRSSQNTWFIEAVNPNDQALLISKVKKKGKFLVEDEGTYHMPFGLTVTCQTSCPDRFVE